MSQDSYQRERQVKQYEERQRAQKEKHHTLEAWQIEQEAAQQGTANQAGEYSPAPQGLLARMKKLLRLK